MLKPDTKQDEMKGKRFGCVVVVRRSRFTPAKWVCKCDCGRMIVRSHTALKTKKHPERCSCDQDYRDGYVNLEEQDPLWPAHRKQENKPK